MQYKVCAGAMLVIAQMFEKADLNTLGVSVVDFKKVSGPNVWSATDRSKMAFIMNSLLSSTINIIGCAPFQLPAEFIAAGIALWVHPINIHAACRFMERVATAESLGRGIENGDLVKAQQLFALIIQLKSDPDTSHAVVLFERNTGIRMSDPRYAEKKPDEKKGC